MSSIARAEDWPVYRHDNGRTATTAERLAAAELRPAWIHLATQPPRKALYGPAKGDGYREIPLLGDDTRFDSVFHPIVVGQFVYYGSSADDALHCLDASTGKERWIFTAGGPVRLPPSFYRGKLYFGSDDGYAYCVSADDGRLVWRFSPTAGRCKVLNDGRLISRWPVRTGVSIQAGTAYFAASLIPGSESYLCALDAQTGKPEGPERDVHQTPAGRTFMGMMALNDKLLVAPQGRNPAQLFQIPGFGYRFNGSAGCFAMLSGGHLASGSSTGVPVASDTDLENPTVCRAHVGRFEACYYGDKAYLFADGAGTAFLRKDWKPLWNVRGHCCAGIVAGGIVFVGGTDEVRAYDATDGKELWRETAWGQVEGLAVANGALYASTTDGLIYCFRAGAKPAADPYAAAAPAPDGFELPKKKPIPIQLAAGPYIQFTEPSVAIVRWTTEKPSATILEIGEEGRLYHDARPKRVHEVRLDHLRPTANYRLQVRTLTDGQPGIAEPQIVESFFNYTSPGFDGVASPYAQDALTQACVRVADRVVRERVADRGMCFVIGCGDGRLALEIARRTNLCVIGLETDPAQVAMARAALQKTGRYGVRVSVQQVRSYDEIETLPSGCANLIVSQAFAASGQLPGRAEEICRILRPLGGIAVLGRPNVNSTETSPASERLNAWLARASFEKRVSTDGGLWATIRRSEPLPGAGEWTHQYGSPSNAAFGDESLQGATSMADLSIQWLGRPGPRHQADRMVRKPAPLVSNGRLFCQGMGRLTALDAFNGVVLWSLEVPGLNRYNMPRDGGNYCADDDYVYLIHEKQCWKIDASTGKVVRMFDFVDDSGRAVDPTWSHVALSGDLLIGSTAREVSHYHEHWGSDSWFDQRIGPKTGKVCSMGLFALDKETGKKRWSYVKGLVVNSSLTIGDGRMYFVEVRDESLVTSILADQWGRLYGSVPNMSHVALDVQTGKVLWERPFVGDCGMTAFYQAYANGTLVTVGCSQPYKVFAFDAKNGDKRWSADVKLDGEGHGGATQRPVIVGNKIILCTTVVDLKTGERLQNCPRGNCGTACASTFALFYRAGDISMWPVVGNEPSTMLAQVRPDCWLSMVPGSGMFLAPEGGGGCSCGGGLRVSMGLMPRTDTPEFQLARNRFLDKLQVSIDAPLGGDVFYTTDGSDPTAKSAKYRGPITLSDTAWVRARAQGRTPGSPLSLCVERRYEKLRPPQRATAAKVNFQPLDGGPNPAGFWIDTGELAAVHDSGYAYGWTDEYHAMSRLKKYDSPELDTVATIRGAAQWQAAVENGHYEVTLGVQASKDNQGALRVSGVDFKLAQSPADQDWKNDTITRQVEVRDGILRLQAASPEPSARNMNVTHLVFRKL
ncbi:MAG: PQQ-binding-like beta-propeller repeat protein [Planctomycetia bacterium]|nr:PQQ-binding-like beta-propeller repeat protein [Planctomycetia bacterium]